MRLAGVGAVAFILGSLTSCSRPVPSAVPVAASAPARLDMPRVEKGQLDAKDLADFLGVKVWIFRYTGNRPRCWVEIEENGKTRATPEAAIPASDSDTDHQQPQRITLWLQRGRLFLQAGNTGTGKSYPDNSLWWGWGGYWSSESDIGGEKTPRPGEEVTLVRYEVGEQKDAKGNEPPRKMTLYLKAKFAEE
jgi:hypothetical protein